MSCEHQRPSLQQEACGLLGPRLIRSLQSLELGFPSGCPISRDFQLSSHSPKRLNPKFKSPKPEVMDLWGAGFFGDWERRGVTRNLHNAEVFRALGAPARPGAGPAGPARPGQRPASRAGPRAASRECRSAVPK